MKDSGGAHSLRFRPAEKRRGQGKVPGTIDNETVTALRFRMVEDMMNNKLRTPAVEHLFEAILCLENTEECFDFFEDLCTVNEVLSLSQRFEVASMLRSHDTYLKIAEKTGASTATISRVNRSLNYGNDGYDMVFARMKKDEEK